MKKFLPIEKPTPAAWVIHVASVLVVLLLAFGWANCHRRAKKQAVQFEHDISLVRQDLRTAERDCANLRQELQEAQHRIKEQDALRDVEERRGRIRALQDEAKVLQSKMRNTRARIEEANKFHFLRTRKEKMAELAQLHRELNAYADRAIEIDAELATLQSTASI